MTVYNVLGVSCDIVEGEVYHVYTLPVHEDDKWRGDALVAQFPYEAWGYSKPQQVVIDNFVETFNKIVDETMESGKSDADFLSTCGDFQGLVELIEEPTFYWALEKDGNYRVVIDFQFMCENENESADSQCCTVVYMSPAVFKLCIDVGSPNVCEM